jgi:ABC-type multidrug transport system ATPase subunit
MYVCHFIFLFFFSLINIFSYISSTDCHYSLLTVRETLEYAAMLRLRCSDVQSVHQVVERTLLLLDLEKIADCNVGCDEHRSISKGQVRRLTIGCGLVHNASLLLLDQPTCTLDAYLSTSVLDLLRTLADTNRTVLCTIHAPSQSDFYKFDKVRA